NSAASPAPKPSNMAILKSHAKAYRLVQTISLLILVCVRSFIPHLNSGAGPLLHVHLAGELVRDPVHDRGRPAAHRPLKRPLPPRTSTALYALRLRQPPR